MSLEGSAWRILHCSMLDDGDLLKGGLRGLRDGGWVKRHITSPCDLADCGYGWDAIFLGPDSLLNPIATGAPVARPPCPHLSPPGCTTYVMLDGSKRSRLCGWHR